LRQKKFPALFKSALARPVREARWEFYRWTGGVETPGQIDFSTLLAHEKNRLSPVAIRDIKKDFPKFI
jgi:hypothetical protein